jgi:hypothetical protein
MSALSDALSAANTGRHSGREIARLARDRGYTLNHDTAARYLRGDHGRPEESTLVAFADVLDIPMSLLREAANLPTELTTSYVPPAEASRLTRRQRRAVDEVIRSMLEPTKSDGAAAADELSTRRARNPSSNAARRGKPES